MRNLRTQAHELYEQVWHLFLESNQDVYEACKALDLPEFVGHVLHGFVDEGWKVDDLDPRMFPSVVNAFEAFLGAVDGLRVAA